jgi:ribonuclease E
MPNKMLIDATHPEETRVVVLRGHRVEEFDFESANRKQLRGNIYLAKVTRVEPSLQAAFVDYGGNRHGFLAFSEIHPDYYQIPVADRQALIAEDERAQRAAEAEFETGAMAAGSEYMAPAAEAAEGPDAGSPVEIAAEPLPPEHAEDAPPTAVASETPIDLGRLESSSAAEPVPTGHDEAPAEEIHEDEHEDERHADESHADASQGTEATDLAAAAEHVEGEAGNNITEVNGHGAEGEEEVVESVGGADAMEEVPERMPRLRRQYKIQEVIKRRQVMLVQVVKEERGTKGAALTTYLSLAGRYSVLMPNTARGGGISRKITSADDRRRLKEIAQELEVPEGMGVILRTAGAARTKTEVKRDFEYLLRLWETVRDLTLKSTAPTLVYEEGSLVKRSIRDLYNKDIDEILVAGDAAYTEAKDFMRMLMPSHAKNVKGYRDTLPIFTRHGIESQLDAMFTPVMQLRSGGYIVLNQAEALVAIDVNSGRATREHHIEDTALKTNLEAAEEIARQLRLRDLAGLIVIDFIDMDEKRNNRAVERRLKECLRHDRARIQVGHISHFGLLEMSRQRIRSSVLESSTEKCAHCGGTGHVRSVSSVALQLLRSLDEMLLKGATHNLIVRTRTEIALYLLNHKRAHLRSLEERFRIAIMVNADTTIGGQLSFVIEKGEQVHSLEQAKALAAQSIPMAPIEEEDDEEDYEDDEEALEAEDAEFRASPSHGSEDDDSSDAATAASDEARPEGEHDQGRKRRRRRRGRGGDGREASRQDRNGGAPPRDHDADIAAAPGEHGEGRSDEAYPAGQETAGESNGEGERRRRRRGRRGGRRNRRDREGEGFAAEQGSTMEPELTQAVADLDHEPQPDASVVHVPITESPRDVRAAPDPEPRNERPAQVDAAEVDAAQVEARPPPAPVAAEAPRRRSTVREPAPVTSGGDGAGVAPSFTPPAPPSAEPIVSSPAEDETDDRPRRSGWWSKRALGKG